jgi:hypothetical protein
VSIFVGEVINLLNVYVGVPPKVVGLKNISNFEPTCVACAILIKYGERANILAIISFRF